MSTRNPMHDRESTRALKSALQALKTNFWGCPRPRAAPWATGKRPFRPESQLHTPHKPNSHRNGLHARRFSWVMTRPTPTAVCHHRPAIQTPRSRTNRPATNIPPTHHPLRFRPAPHWIQVDAGGGPRGWTVSPRLILPDSITTAVIPPCPSIAA